MVDTSLFGEGGNTCLRRGNLDCSRLYLYPSNETVTAVDLASTNDGDHLSLPETCLYDFSGATLPNDPHRGPKTVPLLENCGSSSNHPLAPSLAVVGFRSTLREPEH